MKHNTQSEIVKVTFQPMGVTYDVPVHETLFAVAAAAGVAVDTICGGNGTCGKCKVRFETDPVLAKPIDHIHLSGGEIQQGYRLSCQVEARRDMVVFVPPAGSRAQVQILHQGVAREVPLRPNVLKIHVPYTNPRLRDGIADWEFVGQTLPRWFQRVHVPLHWLRQLPVLMRQEAGMTITIAGRREVTRLETGDTTPHNYGAAFDIGSTSVVGFLLDLNTGEETAVASTLNKQTAYGDDIIARLSRAQRNPDGLRRMHTLIIEQINALLQELARQAAITPQQINEVTIVGNMTMHHFLLQLDSTYLGLSPYAPVMRGSITVRAQELGLVLSPDTPIFVLPNIAGFVGSDTVGVMLAASMHQTDGITLAVDVGTNGEVALGSKKRLIACSAPAGPAFEGARIKQGMRAAAGAIDHVWFEGNEIRFSVIGGGSPSGICGSALIDITAGLLEAGVLNFRGMLLNRAECPPTVPDGIRERIMETEDRRENYFVLVYAEETGAEQDIIFTQQDIREFQLAKGAIRAGEMVLQQVMALADDDLAEVALAGAFGSYIDLTNARRVNLVPPIPLDRLRAIGNAAGVGARLALVSTQERAAAERIGLKTEHIQLSGLAAFQKAFIQAMRFPLYRVPELRER
ncbi:MAG: ASKHA domain-containing protein [Anaerolineae bacterium]